MSKHYTLQTKGKKPLKNVNLHVAVAEVLRCKSAVVLDAKGNVVLTRAALLCGKAEVQA